MPLSIGSDKCKVAGRQAEGYGLLLAWLEFYLLEGSQATAFGNDACHHITAKEQNTLLADAIACILDINADGEYIAVVEFRFVYAQIAIVKSGIAKSVAEGPLYIHLGIVVVNTFHSTCFLAHAIVIGGK